MRGLSQVRTRLEKVRRELKTICRQLVSYGLLY